MDRLLVKYFRTSPINLFNASCLSGFVGNGDTHTLIPNIFKPLFIDGYGPHMVGGGVLLKLINYVWCMLEI